MVACSRRAARENRDLPGEALATRGRSPVRCVSQHSCAIPTQESEIHVTSEETPAVGELTDCPYCHAPAEILERSRPSSSSNPVEFVRTFCVVGHWAVWPRLPGPDIDLQGSAS